MTIILSFRVGILCCFPVWVPIIVIDDPAFYVSWSNMLDVNLPFLYSVTLEITHQGGQAHPAEC